MLGAAAPYVMAVGAMLFAAASALTLFYAVSHFDPPEVREAEHQAPEKVAV